MIIQSYRNKGQTLKQTLKSFRRDDGWRCECWGFRGQKDGLQPWRPSDPMEQVAGEGGRLARDRGTLGIRATGPQTGAWLAAGRSSLSK